MTPETLLDLARSRGIRIVTAESCTGGLVSAALTDIAGSSDVFDRGFVTYSNSAKTDLLGVPPDLIAQYGAVSEEVACAMAKGALACADAQIAVSVTGVAGPGGTAAKPEGMVCFGLAQDGSVTSETHQFGAIGRHHVRAVSVAHAITLLGKALEKR